MKEFFEKLKLRFKNVYLIVATIFGLVSFVLLTILMKNKGIGEVEEEIVEAKEENRRLIDKAEDLMFKANEQKEENNIIIQEIKDRQKKRKEKVKDYIKEI